MKITGDDFTRLRAAIMPHMRQPRPEGMGDERHRWDALWSSCFDTTSCYAYLNDAQIDTALRAIQREAVRLEAVERSYDPVSRRLLREG